MHTNPFTHYSAISSPIFMRFFLLYFSFSFPSIGRPWSINRSKISAINRPRKFGRLPTLVAGKDTYKLTIFMWVAEQTLFGILLVFTLPMLRLLSSNEQDRKFFFENHLNPVMNVGIPWIALKEYSQISTHMPGFKWFIRIFALFCIGQQQHKGQG